MCCDAKILINYHHLTLNQYLLPARKKNVQLNQEYLSLMPNRG